MLCPSCGDEMKLGARECGCGARIVGEPVGEPVARVQRFAPAMLALSLFICTALAAAVWTKWAATAGIIVIILSRRAIRLALRDREAYGGVRISIGVLALTSVGGACLAGYAIGRIPLALEKRRLAQAAATSATIYEVAVALEEYKSKNGAYPKSDQVLSQFLGRSLPRDYWDQSISYESYTAALAEANLGRRASRNGPPAGVQFNHNFVLRSAGPDGAMGTVDDIVMKDGIFYTSADVVRNPLVR